MLSKVLYIGACVLVGTLILTILYLLSGNPNTFKNGFKRNIKEEYVISFHAKDLGNISPNLIGTLKDQIFFNYLKDPLNIQVIDNDLTNIQSRTWKFPISARSSDLTVLLDSPTIDIYDKGKSRISSFQITHHSPELKSEDSVPGRQFDLGNRISSNSFVLRTINMKLSQYTLTKLSVHEKSFKENPAAVVKQIDGYLCTDGMLFYDSINSKAIYVYYYRNQFLILDSNLNLLVRANTIDTVTHAQIKIHTFVKARYTTFEAPATITNRKASVWHGNLYIQSGLLSDNEDRKMFSNSSIIDVYALSNGNYLYSFYIPRYSKFRVDEFQVFDSLLIAIQGNFIVSYLFNKR
jgi:hypothetical protein